MDLFEEKTIKPMLISEMTKPFNSTDYIYELKLDGLRCIAYLDNNETDLRNKRNMKLLPRFPELKNMNLNVNAKCILDGELVILKNGVPDFYEIQRRTMMSDLFKIELAYKKLPASFVAYDILYLDNRQTTDLPLIKRKGLLEEVIREDKQLAISRYIEEHGIELYNLAKQQNLEGVVAKVKSSKYYFDKRTKDWIKFKFLADKDFIICGYIQKEKGITSLVLGQYRENELLYKGHVTLGVNSNLIAEYNCKRIDYSPFRLMPSGNEDAIWLEPKLVCVVQYMPNEKDLLRQPVFKGIRDDVKPEDVIMSSLL